MKKNYSYSDIIIIIMCIILVSFILRINSLEDRIEEDLEDLGARVTYIEQSLNLPAEN